MESLKEILSIYDNPAKKGFSYFDVSADLGRLPESVRTEADTQSESLAFAFQDNTGKDHWGTYHGPLTTWRRKDNGEEILRPDIKDIKTEDIVYWEKRTKETNNPMMLMRYAGLVFDFKKTITNQGPSYKDITLPYVKSIIDVVEGEYPTHSVEGYYYITRAFEMASKIKSQELFERAQKVLWDYDHKVADDNSAGLWGRHFELMIKYLDKYGLYESKLVEENEQRFERLEKVALENGAKSDAPAHVLVELTELLCEYYKKKGRQEKIKEYIDRLTAVVRISFRLRGGMWAHAMLQRMQVIYRKYHLYKEANKLYIEIQELGSEALDCMQRQEFSIPIDNVQLDTYLNDLLKGTPQEVIVRFLVWNTPNMKIERQRQKEEAEQSPLLDMVRTTNYDASGSPTTNVGVGKDADHQKLMYGMYRRMLITSTFIKLEIQKMMEEKILTKESAIALFEKSPLISKDNREIIERGLDAYFQKDYIVACHLLIPQFESAIRRLVALCGGEYLRANKDSVKGNEYISLDGLLDSDEAQVALGEDVNTYFKNLFTDQYGWNLRNLTSHGLLRSDAFNSTMADRIIHAFLLLSQLKFSEVAQETSTNYVDD